MEFYEEFFGLTEYKVYGVFHKDFTPIEMININQLIIEDRFEPEHAIIIKEHQDAFLTIITMMFYNNNELDYVVRKHLTHTPELLIQLQQEQQESEIEKQKLIDILKERGHKNITSKTEYQDVEWRNYRYELITQIDTKFHISTDKTFKEGREIIKQEGEFLKKYKPEIWGCFMYHKNDTVSKNFRFIFDESDRIFKGLEDYKD